MSAAVGEVAGMPRPLIGITSYLEQAAWGVWRQPAALVPQTYVDAVSRAGGIPVLLPPQRPEAEPGADSGADSGGDGSDPSPEPAPASESGSPS